MNTYTSYYSSFYHNNYFIFNFFFMLVVLMYNWPLHYLLMSINPLKQNTKFLVLFLRTNHNNLTDKFNVWFAWIYWIYLIKMNRKIFTYKHFIIGINYFCVIIKLSNITEGVSAITTHLHFLKLFRKHVKLDYKIYNNQIFYILNYCNSHLY